MPTARVPTGEAALLDDEVLQAIYAHAEQGYPEEVCGIVFAERAEQGYPNAEALRCVNRQNLLHAEDPAAFPRDARTAYSLGAKDLIALDQSRRTDRPARIIYHSHIDVGAHFSAEDLRAAAPDGQLLYPVDYLIVDAAERGARGARLFRFEDGRFVQIAAWGAAR